MMNPELDHRIDPVQYLRMVWRRKWIVALCSVLVICGTLIRLEFVPDEYQSHASIMVDDRQLVAGGVGQLMSGMGAERLGRGLDERRYSEVTNRILSRPFLERVVRLLRMNEDPEILKRAGYFIGASTDLGLEEAAVRVAVEDLQSKVNFSVKGSNIFRIWITDTSPDNAQLLARWISELYVDSRAQRALRDLNDARDFGEQQLAIYQQRLQDAENALEQFDRQRIQSDLSTGTVQQGNVNAAEALYRAILDEAEAVRLRSLGPSTSLAASELAGQRRVVLEDPRVVSQRRGLESALIDEATGQLLGDTANSAWPPSSGSYVTLRRGLLQLVERIVQSSFPDVSPAARTALERYTFLTLDREAQAATADFLADELSRFRARQQSGPRGELERARLENEVVKAQDLLDSFQTQLIAANVNQAVTASDMGVRIEILNPAQLPLSPSGPDRAKALLAAVLLGPFFGIAVAFTVEIVDPTLRSLPDFARAFDGPILGTAPLVSKSGARQGRGLRSYAMPAAVGLVIVLTVAFFATREALFADMGAVERPTVLVDPEAGGAK